MTWREMCSGVNCGKARFTDSRRRRYLLMKTGVGKRIVDWYYERSGQFIEALEQMPAAVGVPLEWRQLRLLPGKKPP